MRIFWIVSLFFVLVTSGAMAKEEKSGKRTKAPANKEKREEALPLPRGKKPESVQTKGAAGESTVPSRKDNTPSKGVTSWSTTRGKVEEEQKKERGLLPSLRRMFNGTNDYFIDKNGDGVSDWWEKKKREKVKPRTTPKKRRTTKSQESKEKKRRK